MMNDIPKNGAGSIPQQSSKVEQVKAADAVSENIPTVQENTPQVTPKDLPSVDSIGRSLVSTDNIEQDLKFFQENPKVAAAALDYFDKAYAMLQKAGHENPYEESCSQMGACAKEFAK